MSRQVLITALDRADLAVFPHALPEPEGIVTSGLHRRADRARPLPCAWTVGLFTHSLGSAGA